MPTFEIRADDGCDLALLDKIEATNVREAIALTQIRLERRDLQLRRGENIIARVSKDGQVTVPSDVSRH